METPGKKNSLTLFYSPGACSLAAHALLYELGVKFEAIEVSIKDGKNFEQDYLALNPRARVPLLIHGENKIREGVAILYYLDEISNRRNLQPDDPAAKALCHEWMLYGTATIHPFFAALWRTERFSSKPEHFEDIRKTSGETIKTCFREVEEFLGDKEFLLGSQPFLCDLYFLPLVRWLKRLPDGFSSFSNIPRYYDNLLTLSCVKRAMQVEKI